MKPGFAVGDEVRVVDGHKAYAVFSGEVGVVVRVTGDVIRHPKVVVDFPDSEFVARPRVFEAALLIPVA